MMNLDSFFAEVRDRSSTVAFDREGAPSPAQLSNEAMFHLPLIAITILMLSKGHSKPEVGSLGQLVGECFENTFVGFRGSAQHLGWSASLRVRTVQALNFLVVANLAAIESTANKVNITVSGRKLINAALATESDLRFTLYTIERNYRNIRAERQSKMDFV